jgi:mannose-6-phosphate isomerase-like protein (cupin superfamily)
LHYHREVEEIFYVTSGTLTLRLGSNIEHLEAGCAVHIPAGTPHQGQNRSSEPVKFVVVKAPHRANDKYVLEE